MAEELGQQAALVAGGTALGWLGNWLLQLRRDKRDAAGAAIDALRAAMGELRTEVERLSESVDEAREAEARCRAEQRLARDDIHALRNALQAAGMRIPPLPSEARPAVSASAQ